MKLGLVENEPAARAAPSSVEGRPELLAERRRGPSMFRRRPWMGMEHTEDDLAHHGGGQRAAIFVRCGASGACGHAGKIVSRAATRMADSRTRTERQHAGVALRTPRERPELDQAVVESAAQRTTACQDARGTPLTYSSNDLHFAW